MRTRKVSDGSGGAVQGERRDGTLGSIGLGLTLSLLGFGCIDVSGYQLSEENDGSARGGNASVDATPAAKSSTGSAASTGDANAGAGGSGSPGVEGGTSDREDGAAGTGVGGLDSSSPTGSGGDGTSYGADGDRVANDGGNADAGLNRIVDDASASFDGANLRGEDAPADGSPQAAVDAQVPRVVSAAPTSGSTNLERTTPFTVTFSQPMRLESLRAGGLKLMLGTAEATGTVGLSSTGTVATFAPSEPLVLAATYRLVVSSTAQTVDGISIAGDWQAKYTIREGRWSSPATVESTPTHYSRDAAVGMDGRGNALLAWMVLPSGASSPSVRTARYTRGSGWSASAQMSSDGQTGSGALAVASGGRAIYAWNSSAKITYASTFDGSTWAAPKGIGSDTDGTGKSVGIDAAGNALTVWVGPAPNPGSPTGLAYRARPFAPGSGWAASVTAIDTVGTYNSNNGHAAIVVGRNGEAGIVYSGSDPTDSTPKLLYSRYAPGALPAFTALAAVPESVNDFYPAAATNSEGSGFLVSKRSVATSNAIYLRSVDANGNWGSPQLLSDLSSDAFPPAIAVGADGTAAAAWMQYASGSFSTERMMLSHYASGTGWTSPVSVWSGAADSADLYASPGIFLDAAGNGVVWWHSGATGVDSFVRVQGDTWQSPSSPEPVVPSATSQVSSLLAASANGDAIAVWSVPDPQDWANAVLWYRTFN